MEVVSMATKAHGGARKGAGRKSNAEKGLALREGATLAIRLSPEERARLEKIAGDEELSVWARGVLFSVAK
jgi:hypothetical protein